MIQQVIGFILDAGLAAIGVLALFFAGRCVRGRKLIRLAGCLLILYTVIAVAWRVYMRVRVFDPGSGGLDNTVADNLFEILSLIRSLTGSLVLTAVVLLLVMTLVIRSKHEFTSTNPFGVPPAGQDMWRAYGGAPQGGQLGTTPPGPAPRYDPGPGAAWNPPPAQENRPAPEPWRQPAEPPHYPSHGEPPREDPGAEPR